MFHAIVNICSDSHLRVGRSCGKLISVLFYLRTVYRPLHPAGNPAKNDLFFENTAL
jgi:hypothetical protein